MSLVNRNTEIDDVARGGKERIMVGSCVEHDINGTEKIGSELMPKAYQPLIMRGK